MAKEKENKKNSSAKAPFRWLKRMFLGASKDLDIFEVEKLESPSKQAVKALEQAGVRVIIAKM